MAQIGSRAPLSQRPGTPTYEYPRNCQVGIALHQLLAMCIERAHYCLIFNFGMLFAMHWAPPLSGALEEAD